MGFSPEAAALLGKSAAATERVKKTRDAFREMEREQLEEYRDYIRRGGHLSKIDP